MTHLIFTRFNVGLFNRNNFDMKAWTTHRRNLFEKYCLPSLQNQTSKKFKWFLFYDNSDNDIKDYGFESVKVTDVNYEKAIERITRDHYDGKGMLITTRLDNDDMFHKEFVEKTQEVIKQLNPKGILGLNFPYGYCYQHGSGKKTMIGPDLGTTFISVASWERYVTVHNWPNTKIPHAIPTVQYGKKPMWARIIHDKNLSNVMEGVPTSDSMEGFF